MGILLSYSKDVFKDDYDAGSSANPTRGQVGFLSLEMKGVNGASREGNSSLESQEVNSTEMNKLVIYAVTLIRIGRKGWGRY